MNVKLFITTLEKNLNEKKGKYTREYLEDLIDDIEDHKFPDMLNNNESKALDLLSDELENVMYHYDFSAKGSIAQKDIILDIEDIIVRVYGQLEAL